MTQQSILQTIKNFCTLTPHARQYPFHLFYLFKNFQTVPQKTKKTKLIL